MLATTLLASFLPFGSFILIGVPRETNEFSDDFCLGYVLTRENGIFKV
jgi:hypothetical protein